MVPVFNFTKIYFINQNYLTGKQSKIEKLDKSRFKITQKIYQKMFENSYF